MTNKTNVLFFFTDDQRFDTIHALGNETIKTPNLDRLVNRGTSFTRAHIPGGTHGAVCMPSRAMLHTGRTLFHLDNHGEEISEDHHLMGECFQQMGYNSFGTGKWHNGVEAYKRSFNCGGHVFYGGMADHWNVPAYKYNEEGHYPMQPVVKDFIYSNEVTMRHCGCIQAGVHSTELFCQDAKAFIKDYDDKDPFFMYVSLMAPHDPRTMPEEYMNLYNPDDIELPPNYQEKHFDYGVHSIRDEVLAASPREEKEIKRHIAEYYGMISHIDAELGKVLDVLEEKGLLETTLIIFSGDNGLAIGQHGLMGKQSCYEHSVRIPLILSGPQIPQGETRDAYVYLSDIFPTLCDYFGHEIPDSVEGESFLEVILDKKRTHRETLYLAYGDKCRAIKNKNLKYLQYRHKGKQHEQLFHLKEDPFEIANRIDDPLLSEELEILKTALYEEAKKLGDPNHETGKHFWDMVIDSPSQI